MNNPKTSLNREKKSPRSKEGPTDFSSLDELPDTVYVPLGRRGMESLPLQVCQECDKENLTLIKKTVTRASTKGSAPKKDPSAEKEFIDYTVRCQECGYQFIIRLKRVYVEEELIQTFVYILNKPGGSEQWLGNLF